MPGKVREGAKPPSSWSFGGSRSLSLVLISLFLAAADPGLIGGEAAGTGRDPRSWPLSAALDPRRGARGTEE